MPLAPEDFPLRAVSESDSDGQGCLSHGHGRVGKGQVWRESLNLRYPLRRLSEKRRPLEGEGLDGSTLLYKARSPCWRHLGHTITLARFVSGYSTPPPAAVKNTATVTRLALNLWLLTSHESFSLPMVIRDSLVTFPFCSWWYLWRMLPLGVLNVISGLKCLPFSEALAGHPVLTSRLLW